MDMYLTNISPVTIDCSIAGFFVFIYQGLLQCYYVDTLNCL